MTTRVMWFAWGAGAATIIWFLSVPAHKVVMAAVIVGAFILDAMLRWWLRRRRTYRRPLERRA